VSPAPLPAAADLTEVFRRAPIGVLVLGGLLFFVGAGFILSGVFFALSGTAGSWLTWLLMLAVGPLFLYVALQFVLLRRRAWLVIVLLVGLLLLSSLLRSFTAPALPVSPLAEIVVELLTLAYLVRPRVRAEFAREADLPVTRE
jgi:hypothetical protein